MNKTLTAKPHRRQLKVRPALSIAGKLAVLSADANGLRLSTQAITNVQKGGTVAIRAVRTLMTDVSQVLEKQNTLRKRAEKEAMLLRAKDHEAVENEAEERMQFWINAHTSSKNDDLSLAVAHATRLAVNPIVISPDMTMFRQVQEENDSVRKSLSQIVTQLKSCRYECEAGPLENNLAFVELERLATACPPRPPVESSPDREQTRC